MMKCTYPQSLREFELISESTYERLREMQLTPVEMVDDHMLEEAAELVRELLTAATYFDFPEPPAPVGAMCTPLKAMKIVGHMLRWVRSERLRESPFLDIRQALRYIGGTSEKQIYGAIERGQLDSMRSGKELRFTVEMLERSMQR